MRFSHRLERCLLCNATDLDLIVPLAPIPIATPVLNLPSASAERGNPFEPVPIDLNQCRSCGHIQLSHAPNPEFEYTDFYVYTTSLSIGLAEHFAGYVAEVLDQLRPPAGSTVVEFGSNDGTVLKLFKDAGMKVIGVEPARAPAQHAIACGIPTIVDFFSSAVARRIIDEHGLAHVVVANNVMANVEDLSDAADAVAGLLAPDGVFVFETQYGADVIDRLLIDTIYHEHLSYFLLKPLAKHFEQHGLEIIDVKRTFSKGGAIRVAVQKSHGPRKASSIVAEMISDEERRRMFAPAYYAHVAPRLDDLRRCVHRCIDEAETRGKPVAGYGVSVGTNTLLAQFDLAKRISFLCDDDPKKTGPLLGPDYSIPLEPPQALEDRMPGAVVVFAWRYWQGIVRNQRGYAASGGRFIIPLPYVSVV